MYAVVVIARMYYSDARLITPEPAMDRLTMAYSVSDIFSKAGSTSSDGPVLKENRWIVPRHLRWCGFLTISGDCYGFLPVD
jgi:hypothetical protein